LCLSTMARAFSLGMTTNLRGPNKGRLSAVFDVEGWRVLRGQVSRLCATAAFGQHGGPAILWGRFGGAIEEVIERAGSAATHERHGHCFSDGSIGLSGSRITFRRAGCRWAYFFFLDREVIGNQRQSGTIPGGTASRSNLPTTNSGRAGGRGCLGMAIVGIRKAGGGMGLRVSLLSRTIHTPRGGSSGEGDCFGRWDRRRIIPRRGG